MNPLYQGESAAWLEGFKNKAERRVNGSEIALGLKVNQNGCINQLKLSK